jgi:hypothetical protein
LGWVWLGWVGGWGGGGNGGKGADWCYFRAMVEFAGFADAPVVLSSLSLTFECSLSGLGLGIRDKGWG